MPVTVVLPPRTLLLDVAGPIEVLRKANLEQSVVKFQIRYVSPTASVASSVGLTLSGLAPLPDSLPQDGLLILTGSARTILGDESAPGSREATDDRAIIEWLQRTVHERLRLVCICSGALMAARAGLLDGKRCTTHHGATAELRRLAPRARVEENRLFR
jgi:transcriptional regulator GlxA family with amidase domain